VLGVVASHSIQAQTFTVLHNFKGSPDGAYPYAGLIEDGRGNLYGTTSDGGSYNYGIVFKVGANGAETRLYTFAGKNDGGTPYAGLIKDKAGNFYGTTYGSAGLGPGTVFKLSKSGTETVLYIFSGSPDGGFPLAGLIQDKAANLFGTTEGGGTSGVGTVFEVSATGTETVLYSFTGGADGGYPSGGVIMDAAGDLYGTTQYGGSHENEGVVYKLTQTGILTVLHSFVGGKTDGCYPFGTPVMDRNGNLYGTALGCGSSQNGIVWKVSQDGTESVLHNFAGGASDGKYPAAGLIMDANGSLYGDTQQGGASGDGTVYKLNKKGALTLLHSFSKPHGKDPQASLIRDAKGNLYGTTVEGGRGGYGTVWKLTP